MIPRCRGCRCPFSENEFPLAYRDFMRKQKVRIVRCRMCETTRLREEADIIRRLHLSKRSIAAQLREFQETGARFGMYGLRRAARTEGNSGL